MPVINDGAGGPDAYGYRYIDSDTTAPGAPVYNWRSIRDVGTPILGFGDDNVVGPFPIGFEFPYYWYTVNSIYAGSNGYITFGDPVLEAAPFVRLPNSARPNNVVAPFMNDLDFSPTPISKAYYWTSPGLDTFIVEYDSVQFWGQSGSWNSFQVILSRPDSAITCQYQTYTLPSGITDLSVGMENIIGSVGLSYLFGTTPSRNLIHSSLAVRYYPPETCTLSVHDVATWRVMNEGNGAEFIIKNNRVDLMAKIKNTGNQPKVNVPAYCFIRNAANSVVFGDTITIPTLAPGEIHTIDYFDAWTPTDTGLYRLLVYTVNTPDIFRRNDSMSIQLRSIDNLGSGAVLKYGIDTAQALMSWNGNSGGFGNYFVPPTYPCVVTQAQLYMANASAVGCTLWLFDDDGVGGTPGTVLARATVDVSTAQWYNLDVNPPARITDGGFFVGGTSGGTQAPGYGQDMVKPRCRRSWEYTGGWATSRDNDSMNVMARAKIDSFPLSCVYEDLPRPKMVPATLSAHPNPFQGNTEIRFARPLTAPVELRVYNLNGEVVRTLPASGTSVTWDGKDSKGVRLARGIYVAMLGNDRTSLLKVVRAD